MASGAVVESEVSAAASGLLRVELEMEGRDVQREALGWNQTNVLGNLVATCKALAEYSSLSLTAKQWSRQSLLGEMGN